MNLLKLSQAITRRQLGANGLERIGLQLLRRTLPLACEQTGIAPNRDFEDYEDYHDYLIFEGTLPDPEQRQFHVEQYQLLEQLLTGLDPVTLEESYRAVP